MEVTKNRASMKTSTVKPLFSTLTKRINKEDKNAVPTEAPPTRPLLIFLIFPFLVLAFGEGALLAWGLASPPSPLPRDQPRPGGSRVPQVYLGACGCVAALSKYSLNE